MTTDMRSPQPSESDNLQNGSHQNENAQNGNVDSLHNGEIGVPEALPFVPEADPSKGDGTVADINQPIGGDTLRFRGADYRTDRERLAAEKVLEARSSEPQEENELTVERVYRGVRYSPDGERYAPENIQITRGSKSKINQWFYDRRVANKQLTGLLASKALTVLGFIFFPTMLLSRAGHRQLLSQTL